MKRNVILFLGLILFFACGEDGPDFEAYAGSYTNESIRDECPDPSQNASVAADENGVCLLIDDNIQCQLVTLDLAVDGTYALTSQRSIEAFGSLIPQAPITDRGVYTIDENQLIFDMGTADEFSMAIVSKSALDWEILTTTAGCSRMYRMSR